MWKLCNTRILLVVDVNPQLDMFLFMDTKQDTVGLILSTQSLVS